MKLKFNKEGKTEEQVKAYEAMEKDVHIEGTISKEDVTNIVKENVSGIENQLDADNPESLTSTVKVIRDQVDNLTASAQKANAEKNVSFNEQIAKAIEENTDGFAKLGRGEKDAKVSIELKAVGTVSTANVTGGTNWGAIGLPGIIESPQTATHLRSVIDVLPAGPGTDFYFMRENGNGEGAPAPVAEGDLKPQFDIDLVESSVKFETIAGWMLLTRKAFNNVRGLASFVQKRAASKLLDVEDAQVLYGTGVSPQIKGILTAGNFVASTSTATVLVEKILDDISLLEDAHKRTANAIVMRPAQYWSFFKNKASGSGEYDLPQGVSFVGNQLYLWGIPVIKTTALLATDYVVGDFNNGADIMQQEDMRVEFSYEDSDNFRKNLVTMRVEETIALPVYGNNYFVKGTV